MKESPVNRVFPRRHRRTKYPAQRRSKPYSERHQDLAICISRTRYRAKPSPSDGLLERGKAREGDAGIAEGEMLFSSDFDP